MSFINFFEKFVENKTTDNRNISETPEQQVFVEEDENLVSVEVKLKYFLIYFV